jgi:hypothetical protein
METHHKMMGLPHRNLQLEVALNLLVLVLLILRHLQDQAHLPLHPQAALHQSQTQELAVKHSVKALRLGFREFPALMQQEALHLGLIARSHRLNQPVVLILAPQACRKPQVDALLPRWRVSISRRLSALKVWLSLIEYRKVMRLHQLP